MPCGGTCQAVQGAHLRYREWLCDSGGQTAGAKSMEASVRAKEAQEQMAQEAEEAYKLRERTKPTVKGRVASFAFSLCCTFPSCVFM